VETSSVDKSSSKEGTAVHPLHDEPSSCRRQISTPIVTNKSLTTDNEYCIPLNAPSTPSDDNNNDDDKHNSSSNTKQPSSPHRRLDSGALSLTSVASTETENTLNNNSSSSSDDDDSSDYDSDEYEGEDGVDFNDWNEEHSNEDGGGGYQDMMEMYGLEGLDGSSHGGGSFSHNDNYSDDGAGGSFHSRSRSVGSVDASMRSLDSVGEMQDFLGLCNDQLVDQFHAVDLDGSHPLHSTGSNTNTHANIDEDLSNLPTEFQSTPPQFKPLTQDEQDSSRSLSFVSVEGITPSLEIVHTSEVDCVLPVWNEDWRRQRRGWEEKLLRVKQQQQQQQQQQQHLKEVQLQRSRTHNGTTIVVDNAKKLASKTVDIRRNRSEPQCVVGSNNDLRKGHGRTKSLTASHAQLNNNNRRNRHFRTNSTGSTSHHSHQQHQQRLQSTTTTKKKKKKYRPPPTLPYPSSKNPNPMVIKSSKKIGKRHARYALTAGMMLGIRESVGGALGVEAEIEIGAWEEWERIWEEEMERERLESGVVGDDDATEQEEESAEGSQKEDESTGGDEKKDDEDVNNSEDGDRDASATDTTPSSSQGSKRTTPSASDASSSSSPARQKSCTTLTTECTRATKYKFPANQFYLGSNTSKPLPHKYKFKVYAPLIFARIRSLFGVEKQTFLHSICGKFNFYEFASNARSGQVSDDVAV
jgi:hypothetical protein